jgi:Transposase DDE domain group 1
VCAIVALALDITAWMQTLALTHHDARRWEPKRLRHRLFSIPASIARTARQTILDLFERAPWAAVAVDAIHKLDQLRAPADPAASRPDQPHHPDPWNPAPRDDNGPLVIPLRQNQTHTEILKPSQRPKASR